MAAIDRSQKRKLVGHRCDLRETLANLNPRHGRGDWLELTADFLGSLSLDFPHVLMRRTAPEEHVDDCLVGTAVSAGFLSPQDIRQTHSRHAGHREAANFQKTAAGHAVAERSLFFAMNCEHFETPGM